MKKIINSIVLLTLAIGLSLPHISNAKSTYYKSSSSGRFTTKTSYKSNKATTYKSSTKTGSGSYYYKSASSGKFVSPSTYKSKPSSTYRSRR